MILHLRVSHCLSIFLVFALDNVCVPMRPVNTQRYFKNLFILIIIIILYYCYLLSLLLFVSDSISGRHVTIVAHSRSVQTSLEAAQLLEKEDVDCEVRLEGLFFTGLCVKPCSIPCLGSWCSGSCTQ